MRSRGRGGGRGRARGGRGGRGKGGKDVVLFDDSARVEFITGFKKRKDQRRKDAVRQQLEAERAQRILERKKVCMTSPDLTGATSHDHG